MPQGMTGVSSDTSKRLILDVGRLYFNIDESALEDNGAGVSAAIAAATLVGATRGGATFTRGATIREIEVDGALGPIKGLRRRERVEPTLQISMLEQTRDNLLNTMAGAILGDAFDDYKSIKGGPILDESYIDNLALLTTYTGSDDPIIVVLRDVLSDEPFDMAFEDRDEVASDVTFKGHFDPDDMGNEPWAIYHPGQSSGGGPGAEG